MPARGLLKLKNAAFRCQTCNRPFDTSRGLRGHNSKSQKCRDVGFATLRPSPSTPDGQPGDHCLMLSQTDLIDMHHQDENQLNDIDLASVSSNGDEFQPIDIVEHLHAGRVLEFVETGLQATASKLASIDPENQFYPFSCHTDWEVAAWLSRSGMSQKRIDDFFKLSYVRDRPLSFMSARTLQERVTALPDIPRWKFTEVKPKDVTASTERLFLFLRDPVECVKHLLADPGLSEGMTFVPQRVYTNKYQNERIYHEMWTGNWWWRMQDQLNLGSTIIPIVIASDMTNLTHHGGDKSSWPVYMSIGNISKKIRFRAKSKAFMLIAYIPIPKIRHRNRDLQKAVNDSVYHQCMRIILRKIAICGRKGMEMADSFGHVRRCFTLIASHIADHEEKWLSAIAMQSYSATTLARAKDFGNATRSAPRNRAFILKTLKRIRKDIDPKMSFSRFVKESRKHGLTGVDNPWWKPHLSADPHYFLTTELLHTVHKFWRDHIFSWIKNAMGSQELDRRLKSLHARVGFRTWRRGIAHITQWTGREDRELQRYIVAVASNAPGITRKALKSLRAAMDFIYLAQYESHRDTTLGYMTNALKTFHATKAEWLRIGARRGEKGPLDHFEIPKLAAWLDIADNVVELGTAPQHSADFSEAAHKTKAKLPYRHTNRKDFAVQMCRYLDRIEKIDNVERFHAWNVHLQAGGRHDDNNWIEVKIRSRSALNAIEEGRVLPLRSQTEHGAAPSVLDSGCIHLPKPHLREKSLATVAALFRLPDLRPALADYYLSSETSETRPNRRVATENTPLPPAFDWIDVWCKMRMNLPAIQDDNEIKDYVSVMACPPIKEFPFPRCYPVLVCDNEDAKMVGIEGYLVAQVRCIFSSCSAIERGRYHRDPKKDGLLAYVQWFSKPSKELTGQAGPNQMYVVERSRRSDGSPLGDVVPLAAIARPIDLVPKFTASFDFNLINADNVLEEWDKFYVNCFWDKETYQAVY